MAYTAPLPVASPRARRVARLATPVALIASFSLAACSDEQSPASPGPFTTAPAFAKGGNGGGGGTAPAPTGRLYFTSDIYAPGNLDIYAINPDGAGLVRLTTDAGADQVARAATTIGRVAFVGDRNDGRHIFVMNSDGSNQQSVYMMSSGMIQNIALSADGSRIAFIATIAGQTDLWTIGADGTGLTQLTNDPVVEQSPAWAPNGKYIAYSATVNGTEDIFQLSVSKKTIANLTAGANGGNSAPSYSPDGRTIAFTSTRDGNYELYTMSNSGTKQTRILETQGWHEVFPVYSPDGYYVAYLKYLASGSGVPLMNWIKVGLTGQTGPVSGGYAIYSVSWGM